MTSRQKVESLLITHRVVVVYCPPPHLLLLPIMKLSTVVVLFTAAVATVLPGVSAATEVSFHVVVVPPSCVWNAGAIEVLDAELWCQ